MSTENLQSQEAIEKLQSMVNAIDVGMMCSYPTEGGAVHAVPMSRQEVDSEGNIWYLLSSESETYKHLEKNSLVSVLFANPSDYHFLTVTGHAELSQDQERIDKYWNKFVEAWFEKGKDDPRVRVLKVNVHDANYWDTKTNKLFTFFKVVANVVTGSKMDLGREGSLDI